MKKLRNVLALLAALTMTAHLSACTESGDSTPTETNAAATTAVVTTAQTAAETVLTTASAAATSAAATQAESSNAPAIAQTFEIKNGVYSLTAQAGLPEVGGLQIKTDSEPSPTMTDPAISFSYQNSDEKKIYYTVSVQFYPFGGSFMDDLRTGTNNGKGFAATDLANGCENFIKNSTVNDKPCTEAYVFGSKFLSGALCTKIRIEAKNEGTAENTQLIAETIAKSLKMTGNDSGMTDAEGYFLGGNPSVTMPKQISLAGQNCAVNQILSGSKVELNTEVQDGDYHFTVKTISFTKSISTYIKEAEKPDSKYKKVTVGGKEAVYRPARMADGTVRTETSIQLTDDISVLVYGILDKCNADGKALSAGDFSKKTMEMMDDANAAATEKMILNKVDEFVRAMRVNGAAVSGGVLATTVAVTTTAAATTSAVTTTTTTTTDPPRTTAAPKTTAAEQKPEAFGLPMDISDPFSGQKEISIKGKGFVHATNGLRMRQSPSLSSKQITTVKVGTTVDILGLAVTGDPYDWKGNNTRWYRIKTGGKEGYVSADYLAATFTQKPEALSAIQLAGMTNFLYCQHFKLFNLLLFDGGFNGSTDINDCIEVEWGEYQHITPNSLTLDSILKDFCKYFSKPAYYERVKAFFRTENGKLYAAAPYIEVTHLETQKATEITAVSDSEIRAQTIRGYSLDGEKYQEKLEFVLCYEDGCWKVSKACSFYSDNVTD